MADELDRAAIISANHTDACIAAVRDAVNARGTLICEVCEEPIPARRREALPAARTCRPCQEAMEKPRVR
jgi:phage/conjugal plasmid C-4 type zinc finger TraR family protein